MFIWFVLIMGSKVIITQELIYIASVSSRELFFVKGHKPSIKKNNVA